MSQPQSKPTLLSLPYDIRHQIYTHLFPPPKTQLYLQAIPKTYFSILAPEQSAIPTSVFRVCRALHAETTAYLYGGYLFNIVGLQRDCLAAHDDFLPKMRKYVGATIESDADAEAAGGGQGEEGQEGKGKEVRKSVHVHALGNGAHSRTMCISLHAGAGKGEVVRRRERGVVRRIEDVRDEVRRGEESGGQGAWRRLVGMFGFAQVVYVSLAVLAGVLAWCVVAFGRMLRLPSDGNQLSSGT